MSDFLPQDYKEPVTSRYMKFEEGANRFRVLPAKDGKQILIMGWEYWKTGNENKRYPCRVKEEKIPIGELEINPTTGEMDMPKFFWAFTVWNYDAEAIQILELKQKTIRQAIESLARNPKWGTPIEYDIVVTQTVENGKTSYSVTPDPKEKLDKEIEEKYNLTSVNLDALYGRPGTDPFISNEQLEDVKEEDIELPSEKGF